VDQYDSRNGMHHVSYDDGDKRWYDMSKKVYRLVDDGGGGRDSKEPAVDPLPPPITQARTTLLVLWPHPLPVKAVGCRP
jgi:hypothetical protein